MTDKRIMARFHEDDIIDALRVAVGPTVRVKLTDPCDCCNAVIGYARDPRALWIFPQLWPTTLPPGATATPPGSVLDWLAHVPRVIGFETSSELEAFLAKLQGKQDFDAFAPQLRAAFADGAN